MENNAFPGNESHPKIDLAQVKQWLSDFKSGLPEPWGETLDGAVKWVRRNPKTAASIGVAAGFAVGFLGARRISRGFQLAAKNPKTTSFAMQALSGVVAAVALKSKPAEAPTETPFVSPNDVSTDDVVPNRGTAEVTDASSPGFASSPDGDAGRSDVESANDPQMAVELGESTGVGSAPEVVTSAGVPGEDRPLSPSVAQAGNRA